MTCSNCGKTKFSTVIQSTRVVIEENGKKVVVVTQISKAVCSDCGHVEAESTITVTEDA